MFKLSNVIAASLVLGAGGSGTCMELIDSSGDFSPVRIKLEIDDIDTLSRSEQVYLLTTLIPHAVGFFENAMTLRSYGKPIPIEMGFAGRDTIHLIDHDIAVFLSAMECELDGGETTAMIGAAFAWDACGRPTAGALSVCKQYLAANMGTNLGRAQLASGLVHELVHIFGFLVSSMERWWNPITMDPLVENGSDSSTVWYHCLIGEDDEFHVEWDVPQDYSEENMYRHTFMPRIVSAIDARGLAASDCRCPVDPSREYSNEDIEYCLSYPEHCAVAIVTPTVVQKTRDYFGCPSAQGLELENMIPFECGGLFNDHWKTRVLRGELMNSRDHQAYPFISPMTFAALEDSGWYRMDYTKLNSLVRGASWGFQEGCGFLTDRCLNIPLHENIDVDKFCFPSQEGQVRCSEDATIIEQCDAGSRMGRWAFMSGIPHANLPVYNYGSASLYSAMRYMDFCPSYVFMEDHLSRNLCASSSKPTGRCLTLADSLRPLCFETRCDITRTIYFIESNDGGRSSEPCREPNQVVEIGGLRVTCTDPTVICADWKYTHLLPDSPLNQDQKELALFDL
jgi:hypothetical protein